MKKILLSLMGLSFFGLFGLSAAATTNQLNNLQINKQKILQQVQSPLFQDVTYKQTKTGDQHSGSIVTDAWGNDHLSMWGKNIYGQIGDGNTKNKAIPVEISLPENKIKDLDLGGYHSGAVTTDAQGNDHLYMWGLNNYGQIGNGTNSIQNTPIEIALPENKIKDLDLGGYHSGAVTTDAQGDDHLYMWGNNNYGQIGNGTNSIQNTPIEIALPENKIKDLDLGYYFSGVVTNKEDSDQLYMWGSNSLGQIGDGSTNDQYSPKAIALPEKKIKDLSLGSFHSGAVTTDVQENDHLYMWGSNSFWAIGDYITKNIQHTPLEIALPENKIKDLDLGYYFSGVVTNKEDSDQLYMWGLNNYGQVGNGNDFSQSSPKIVFISEEISELSLGGYHASFINKDALSNDHLYVWGRNDYGQVGNNTIYDQMKPLDISNSWYANQIENLKITKAKIGQDYVTFDLSLTYSDLNWVNINQISGKYISLNVPEYSMFFDWYSTNSNQELTGYVTIDNLRSKTIYSDLILKATNTKSNSNLTINIPPFITLPVQ